MRELGRGGSLVAATIAALNSRAGAEHKTRSIKTRNNKIIVPTINEEILCDDRSQRTSGYSERPLSTASEASERDSASVQSSEDPPPQEMSRSRSLMSDCEYLTEPLDEETEERAAAGPGRPAVRSYLYSPMGTDSDSPDEATVKCTAWSEVAVPRRADSSDTKSSSSTDDDSDAHEFDQHPENNYQTLTPSRRLDNSTRRDDDFKWMPTGNIVDDEDIEPTMDAKTEEYAAASLDRRRRTPSDRSERDRKSRSSLSSKPPQHPTSVRTSPRPRERRVRHEESPGELQRRWNSYEHFRWAPPEGGWWPPVCWCHAPAPPPCCAHDRAWPSHPSLTSTPTRGHKNDAEDRVRRLEADKESLHLQVQVLSEQIAAQSEKMSDLERALHDTRQRLDDADHRLQQEMLQRSSLETQKLELLSKLSEVRLRVAERGILERSPPPDSMVAMPVSRPAPPRTPPANYGRQIERNTQAYSSLPRSSALCAARALGNAAAARGHSVPNLADKPELGRGSPSPALGPRLEAAPPPAPAPPPADDSWQTTDVREWDADATCGWLESAGLDAYVPAARAWLAADPRRGLLAAAAPAAIEKELAIKHPMHKKKIVLAIADMLGTESDPLLRAAGALDGGWVLRWLEDAGAGALRGAAADARLDGRTLHRLTHHDLHHHLRVTHALHALSIKRGIQVLRAQSFDPDTMVRRAAAGEAGAGGAGGAAGVARWSSHRVMQWLKAIDLAEYAPNLRGAGVHGGLMLLEPRFTAELLAALLNIPASKTLLRRHLTQRFNDLLGRDVIQQKRNAEQTLGYQPLTATTKYKVPKKSQFSLKRKKSKDELDLGDLVCSLADDGSDDESRISSGSARRVGCLSPA